MMLHLGLKHIFLYTFLAVTNTASGGTSGCSAAATSSCVCATAQTNLEIDQPVQSYLDRHRFTSPYVVVYVHKSIKLLGFLHPVRLQNSYITDQKVSSQHAEVNKYNF